MSNERVYFLHVEDVLTQEEWLSRGAPEVYLLKYRGLPESQMNIWVDTAYGGLQLDYGTETYHGRGMVTNKDKTIVVFGEEYSGILEPYVPYRMDTTL